MTRNAPADFPREIPNHAVGSWLARIGPPFAHMGATGAPAPPSGRTAPGCRRQRVCGVVAVRLGVWGSTGLAARENGRGRRGDHEHRRARLARHTLALLPRADGSEAGGPSPKSANGSARPTRGAKKPSNSGRPRIVSQPVVVQ